ncbi:MAG TPA: zf-HC2 domain-containing protein [Candidatus Acidoferrum sp.]
MSCGRLENKVLGYVDGRLKEGERLEMEKHLSTCAACQLRVNEFRAVNVLLDELPMIEPSAAFDIRMQARVAAEPAKQGWWAWFMPAPRVAFAAATLLLATVWMGSRPFEPPAIAEQDLPVVNSADYDVISSFAPLADLSQAASDDDDASDSNASQQM